MTLSSQTEAKLACISDPLGHRSDRSELALSKRLPRYMSYGSTGLKFWVVAASATSCSPRVVLAWLQSRIACSPLAWCCAHACL